ncbi:MAG: NAD-dependent epimerase/dehydratase family protein [Gemmataceae bacterium]
MRVLLTGGYGCIGSWITKDLLDNSHEVWIYDLRQDLRRIEQILDESQLAKVNFLEGDVTDLAALSTAFRENKITHVIHLAGLQVPVCRADPMLGAHVNVLGTLAVFEAVRQSEGQVSRIVYASSAAVFGPSDDYADAPVSDNVHLIPRTHYGVYKCCNEGNARIYHQDHGLNSIGLRPWTVFGVGRDFGMTSEPTKAVKSVALERPYHITYGGLQDIQFVEDVAKTFARCLEAPYNGAKSYNLRGQVVDLPTFHQALCEVEPNAAELVTYGENQIPIAYDLADDALQNDLGPMPKTSLPEMIRSTLDNFRKLKANGRLGTYDLDG